MNVYYLLFAECLVFIATSPYFRIFNRNTRRPLKELAETTDETRIKEFLLRWTVLKLREAQYVQVAVSHPSQFTANAS